MNAESVFAHVKFPDPRTLTWEQADELYRKFEANRKYILRDIPSKGTTGDDRIYLQALLTDVVMYLGCLTLVRSLFRARATSSPFVEKLEFGLDAGWAKVSSIRKVS